ncbi:MAG: phosphoribosylformylglycinamidine synthase, partial [Betaproteobacteria bacterium]|nr:phosphoribosylformylglycinamidine synthase [Betaproteobacteria bacterium]
MSHFVRLRGPSALSSFRHAKLTQALKTATPGVDGIRAEFWHFVQAERALAADEMRRLERILTYGPRGVAQNTSGELLLVVPRLGTISPWSSKATDIAHHCGLDAVLRVERGVAYTLHKRDGAALTASERAAVAPLVHDRMTETVLDRLEDAERLFHHFEPRPLATIDVIGGGIGALERANREMGLALSQDEISYLFDNFTRIGRNPTDVELMMFAQANSEPCRHQIVNADWIIDGREQPQSLFAMIR